MLTLRPRSRNSNRGFPARGTYSARAAAARNASVSSP